MIIKNDDAGCHWEMEREAFLHPISRLLMWPDVGGVIHRPIPSGHEHEPEYPGETRPGYEPRPERYPEGFPPKIPRVLEHRPIPSMHEHEPERPGRRPRPDSSHPGGPLVRGSSRGDQAALTRFLSGHLMSLIFVDDIKHFEIRPKCFSAQASPLATFYLVWAYLAGLGSRSSTGFGLLQGDWTPGPDLALLISGMRNNNTFYQTIKININIYIRMTESQC
ncbi:hypothetical protein TNCV_3182701 [Trichonephila clavipes]|uniref:Uncharacterized protein n=1 Tax=Trichonephila clavipes TaxID=2585209 RepID=A0A8X6SH93_TRICX|nr:hypothetical protein TNCV_3182701 [Trichonephila clavipes]